MHSSKWDIYIYHDIKAQGTLEKKGREEYKSQRDRGQRMGKEGCCPYLLDTVCRCAHKVTYTLCTKPNQKDQAASQQAASTGLSGLQEDQEGVREKGQEG